MKENWSVEKALELYKLPFSDLIYKAQTIHRNSFNNPNSIQISMLLSIKTGSCSENCTYCPQSAHYSTGIQKEPLMNVNDVVSAAKKAKQAGGTRFCFGAAWRGPRNTKDMTQLCTIISEIKKLGLETCASLGLLTEEQAIKLKESGLDFYNHNIDSSPEYYKKLVTTRTFEDRLNTIKNIRKSGIKVCSGGIIGLGETFLDRIKMLVTLANLDTPPESIPINKLIPIPGTPLENNSSVDSFEFVRIIALARILFPNSYIRLAAGRESMSEELQALCFMAGVNSIFYGEKLLTAANSSPEKDDLLFQKLGMEKITLSN